MILPVYLLLLTLLHSTIPVIGEIGCFQCVSISGNNAACEDPFHHNFTTDIYRYPCLAGRKNRNGLFPATACFKLSGYFADREERVVVRGCALDSGTQTIDTEMIRVSHCGGIVLQDRYVKGCLQSCQDTDGCNKSPTISPNSQALIISGLFLLAWQLLTSHLSVDVSSVARLCQI